MAPCLSKFPSVCLEAIFKHVPLVDLFYSVGMVCSSWYKSRRTELMRRKRLVLTLSSNTEQASLNYHRIKEYGTELIERVRRDDGSPWHTFESPQQFKFNYLPVPEGMQSIPFSSLMNMPNITRLHLCTAFTILNLTQVTRLLDHLSEHLVDLKVHICFYLDRDNEDEDTATREHALDVTNVIGCLNRLHSLRHLHLSLSGLSSNPPLLSCLTHLTTFGISAAGFEMFMSMNGWIYASIMQYGQNVTSIKMDNQVDIREMPQFDAQLATKFNVMSVTHNTDDDLDENEEEIYDMQSMRLFCTRFSVLTILELDLSSSMSAQLPMTKLAQCLSSLTQLVHLNLEFFTIPPVEAEQPQEGEEVDEGNGDGEQAQPQITQVPSVCLLTIIFPTKSHHDSERLFIPEIFPNLQVLRLEHSFIECRDCEISRVYRFERNPERARRIAECKRLTRQPFRRCGHLHTVAFVDSGHDILINLDEL